MKAIDLTGVRFGRLVAEKRVRERLKPTQWECICDCGARHRVTTGNLTSGKTNSCGCLSQELHTTHGMTKDPLYKAWTSMRSRILNAADKDYPNYGGRGLRMEAEWASDFSIFKLWAQENLGEKPTPGHQIDRIDNSLGYLKGNVRYATVVEQQNNRRSNRRLTFNGETMTMKQWCDKLALNYGAVKMRLGSMGWSVDEALGIPTDGSRAAKRALLPINADQRRSTRLLVPV